MHNRGHHETFVKRSCSRSSLSLAIPPLCSGHSGDASAAFRPSRTPSSCSRAAAPHHSPDSAWRPHMLAISKNQDATPCTNGIEPTTETKTLLYLINRQRVYPMKTRSSYYDTNKKNPLVSTRPNWNRKGSMRELMLLLFVNALEPE